LISLEVEFSGDVRLESVLDDLEPLERLEQRALRALEPLN